MRRDREQLEQKLRDEGYPHVYEWHDEPGATYPVHENEGSVTFYVLDGGMTFRFGTKEISFEEGDRFDVPIAEPYSIQVGDAGCTFLLAEVIEGDV